jgi:hypothetical protein
MKTSPLIKTLYKVLIGMVVLAIASYGTYRIIRHFVLVREAQTAHLRFTFGADPKLKPQYGTVRLGAYSGEAADLADLPGSSILHLCSPEKYEAYRKMVRAAYGLDLEDMNYFAIGTERWEGKLERFRNWLLMASKFGDVTVALEPTGKMRYGVFEDNSGMRRMRNIFEELKEKGVTVWIRYASEANLSGSPYTASKSDEKALEFYKKAQWFRSYMPSNAKLVFSPLINTVLLKSERQSRSVLLMFQGGETRQGSLPWDRIGGTIYRTDVPLISSYDTYYRKMSALAPNLPFQVCEVGGPYSRHEEILAFLKLCSEGHWPKIEKVNLFARDINKRADPSGSFGFIEPVSRAAAIEKAKATGQPVVVESWLKPVILKRK